MKPLNYSSSSWSTWVRDNGNVAKFLLKFHLIPYLIPHTHTHYFQFFLLFSLSGRYITSFMILFSLIRLFFPQTLHDATARPLPLTYFSKQPTNQAEPAKVSVKSEKNCGDDGENGFSGVGGWMGCWSHHVHYARRLDTRQQNLEHINSEFSHDSLINQNIEILDDDDDNKLAQMKRNGETLSGIVGGFSLWCKFLTSAGKTCLKWH